MMTKLILKMPYIKSGKSAHKNYLVKYIATRSGVEIIYKDVNALATSSQKELIKQLLIDFPNSKEIYEYKDFMEKPTVKNASEFITMALEHNLQEVIKKENYVGYIANRPNVEKIYSHGLFTSGNEKIILSKVAKEIAEHTGNVWTPIISLRREDAEKTGFDNVERWKTLIEKQAMHIADALKIPHKDFRWYAAMHNEGHHPHIHMICYNANPNKEYLTRQGIANIKSNLMSEIFKEQLIPLYTQKSEYRDTLKKEVRNCFVELKSALQNSDYTNPQLENLITQLSEKLKSHKGKKQFGYLQPHTKNIVNAIVDELANEPNIKSAFNLWQDLQEEILHGYKDTLPPRLKLSEQKEFKSIKNMIINEVLNFEIANDFIEEESHESIMFGEGEILEENDNMSLQSYHLDWSENYKQAKIYQFGNDETPQDFAKAFNLMKAESETNNALAIFDLAKMYADGIGTEKDDEKSSELYKTALTAFLKIENAKQHRYTEYRIGKMYSQGLGTEQNFEIAAKWFEKSADENYKFAEYSLGSLYYRGQGVEQDNSKAFDLYLKSAKQGFPYAQYEVAKMYCEGVGTEINAEESEKYFKLAFNNFVNLEKANPDDKLQFRLGAMLHKGIGTEKDLSKAKVYYEKSANAKNPFASYSLANLILENESSTAEEKSKAVELLTSSAESGNKFAMYKLGKLYFFGKDVEQDKETAIKWLTLSAEQGNEYAKSFLENMDKWNNPSIGFTMKNLLTSLSNIFQDNKPIDSTTTHQKIDSKAMRKLRELKASKGIKHTGEDLENTYQHTM